MVMGLEQYLFPLPRCSVEDSFSRTSARLERLYMKRTAIGRLKSPGLRSNLCSYSTVALCVRWLPSRSLGLLDGTSVAQAMFER
jgi:plasmid replication initiation protein